ncbi:hypothetical protein F5888DRAFT_1806871 [Russula emetica]|nr:hypothetical protein F5888DRAFT_1806871 [Russula emetica]
MVNFRDPFTIASESNEADRFWSFVDGIFIWEFIVTLDYEWSVIRGRRPYRWTIWIYSLTRVATLASVVLNIYTIDVTHINCQVTVGLQFVFAYLAFAASSLLIVLRIIAIWNRNRIIVAFATGVWGINITFLIQGVIRFRASWEINNEIGLGGCVFYLDSIRLSTVVAFAADTILLLIMLFGRPVALFANYRTLDSPVYFLHKGVVWLLLVVATELTPTVFILLDLNQLLDLMFQVPWMIAMSIAATRMYRSLSDFLSLDVSQKIPSTSGRFTFESNGTSTTPVLLAGIQVAVHTTHEQRSTPHANRFNSNISGKPHGKPHELIVGIVNDHDIEGKVEI